MTEFLVVVIVVFLLLYIVGGGVLTVAGLSLFLVAISVSVLIFFVFSLVDIIKSERKTAVFIKIDENKQYKFRTAFYKIGEEEYPNAFPYEKMLSKKLYVKERECKVFLSSEKKKVYDKMSFVTTVAGLISGTALVVLTVFFFVGVVNF